MDLIDKRDEVLMLFLEYGITENKENNLTKTDLAECADQIVKKLIIGSVNKRYLFWFESEGKNGYTFEIEAKDSNDAYDKAYDSYGPQVEGMIYQVI